MGNCQRVGGVPLSLSVDLSQIDGLRPAVPVSVDSSQSPKDVFQLIRHELPRNAASSCFQFSTTRRKFDVCEKSLASLRVKDGERMVLEFKDAKSMTQMTVVTEGSGAKFTFWARKDATVKSVLSLISKKLRLPPEKLHLSSGSIELQETASFDSLPEPLELKLKILCASPQLLVGRPCGMTLEVVCEEASCPKYLQRQTVEVGLGTFEYQEGRRSAEVHCCDCRNCECSIEAMRFRNCSVKFDGEKTDGRPRLYTNSKRGSKRVPASNGVSGSEEFGSAAEELLKGARGDWRRLRLEVCPVQ